ncbi:hypothetical protein, partial [Sinirhodobacter huangdaonensis]
LPATGAVCSASVRRCLRITDKLRKRLFHKKHISRQKITQVIVIECFSFLEIGGPGRTFGIKQECFANHPIQRNHSPTRARQGAWTIERLPRE